MKNKIFYFSGTGNSLKIAKDIQKQLPDSELIKITYDYDLSSEISAETIGFVFPIYCFGLPLIVRNFAKKLKTNKNCYIYGVSTYGGLLCSAMDILAEELKTNGLTMSAAMAINLPGNFIPMYNIKDKPTQEKLNNTAKEKTQEIIRTITNRATRTSEKNLGLLGKFLTHVLYKGMITQMKNADSSFYVDEKCNGCSICAKVCPVENITMEGGKPVWQHNCEQCLACLHWCPEKAIQVGKKTATKERYHHPEVSLQEMLADK